MYLQKSQPFLIALRLQEVSTLVLGWIAPSYLQIHVHLASAKVILFGNSLCRRHELRILRWDHLDKSNDECLYKKKETANRTQKDPEMRPCENWARDGVMWPQAQEPGATSTWERQAASTPRASGGSELLLTPWFQPPGLWESKRLFMEAPAIVICFANPRKLIQHLSLRCKPPNAKIRLISESPSYLLLIFFSWFSLYFGLLILPDKI